MLFSSHSDHSAVNSLHLSISKTLNEKNYKVVNVLLTGKKTPNDFCGDFHWQINPNIIRQKGFFNKLRYHSIVRRCSRFLQSLKADIVLCDGISVVHLIANVQSYYPVKALGVFHGQTRIKPVVSKRLIQHKQYWNYVAVSQSLEKYLKNQSDLFTDENMTVISNAVDVESIKNMLLPRNKARKLLGLPQNGFVFGTVGRLAESKGYKLLIESVSILKKQGLWSDDMRVCIIGDGEQFQALSDAAKKTSVEGEVVLAGEKKSAASYLSAFDVFIMTSRQEGLSIAMLESCVCRLPFVGTEISSFKVLEEAGAVYFPDDNSVALADVMRHIFLLSESERAAMGDSLHEFVCKRFNICEWKKNYLTLIYSCLSS